MIRKRWRDGEAVHQTDLISQFMREFPEREK